MYCQYCGKLVRPGEIGSYKRIVGWVQERKGGGAHGISEAKPTGEVMHEQCWTNKKLDGHEKLF